jgi:hypothetical protein
MLGFKNYESIMNRIDAINPVLMNKQMKAIIDKKK